ncbi:MAG: hypothetical protein ACM4AI_18995 [Acidobacteriota bacterium]
MSCLFLISGANVALAQSARSEPRTAVGVQIGIDPAVGGLIVRGRAVSHPSTIERVNELSFHDVYEQTWKVGAEVSRSVDQMVDVLVRLSYTQARSRGPVELREFTDYSGPSPPYRSTSITTFSDYRTMTIEGGFRFQFGSAGAMRPYAGGVGGLAIIQKITVDPPVSRPPNNTLLARAVVPIVGVIAGSSFSVRPNLHLCVETGLRFQAEPDSGSTGDYYVDHGLDGSRLSVPLLGTVQFRF